MDPRVHERLAGLVDDHPIDVESRLRRVYVDAAAPRYGRSAVMTAAAAAVAVALLVLLCTVFLGREGERPVAAPDLRQTILVAAGDRLLHVDPGEGEITRTASTAEVYSPDLSAQGRIVYSQEIDGAHWAVFVADADRSDPRQLTLGSSNAQDPSWSPDGTKIAFASDRGGNYDIFAMNADGTGVARLETANKSQSYHPAWSPDGGKIAFLRSLGPEGRAWIVWTMNADGSQIVRLPLIASPDQLAWSPDGTELAYSNGQDVYVVAANGRGQPVALTGKEGNDVSPAWSPDGTKIAFLSDRGNETALYAVAAAGGSAVKLADLPGLLRRMNGIDWGTQPAQQGAVT